MFSFFYDEINILLWDINVCIYNIHWMGPFSILKLKRETVVDLHGSSSSGSVYSLSLVLVLFIYLERDHIQYLT